MSLCLKQVIHEVFSALLLQGKAHAGLVALV